LFDRSPPGWAQVRAIRDFVHHHIAFGYEHAPGQACPACKIALCKIRARLA
jgi:hypothetical protein